VTKKRKRKKSTTAQCWSGELPGETRGEYVKKTFGLGQNAGEEGGRPSGSSYGDL